jgi:hypothetical protein
VFTMRRMTAADKPEMMAISARIWEGGDYLPLVFDEWLADTGGEFIAVLLDGRVVGCGKLTFLTSTDAWLEGLRKDPGVPERGMGFALARHFLQLLSPRRDLTSLRFSTFHQNAASIATHERLGFERRVVLSRMTWEGTRGQLAGVSLRPKAGARGRVVTVTDERIVLDFLNRFGWFEATGGLAVEGWRAFPFSPRLLAERYLRTGCCRGVVSDARLAGLSIVVPDARSSVPRVNVVCLDARDAETSDDLFDDLFLSAAATAASSDAGQEAEIQWMVPRVERLKRWCAARGFRGEQEDDFLVYEMPLNAGEQLTAREDPPALPASRS